MDFFEFSDASISKEQVKRKVNFVIYEDSCSNFDFYVIVDHYLKEKEIINFKTLIKNKLELNKLNIKIIYPFKFIPNQKELGKQLSIFYQENCIDLTKEVLPNSKILVMGRSLNSITYNTDIDIKTFYDIKFNKQYFYTSRLKSYVFPIDSWHSWWEKDNWPHYFTFLQLRNIINFNVPKIRIPQLIIKNLEDSNQVLEENLDEKEVAWDIETSGLNFLRDKIGCLTLSFDGIIGYYLSWDKINKRLLSKFLKNKYNILANGKFDIKFLRASGISGISVNFDTLGAGHCLNEMRSNSLKTHAWLYTYYGGYEQLLDNYKRRYKNTDNYLEIPKEILIPYAVQDAIITFQIYKEMKKQFNEIDSKVKYLNKNWTLSRYYNDIMIPSINTFQEIEYNGMFIDWDKVKEAGKYSNKVKNEILDIKKELSLLFNIKLDEINWESNIQLGKLLEKKGWSCQGLSKTGDYLINDETLKNWIDEGYKEASLIIKLHELNTIYNTFIGDEEKCTGYWQYKDKDNKVHSSFSVMLADSGRNKSKNPNLQNIPKRGEYAKIIREFFVPPSEDYYILEVDASGFQLRIGAALSGDTSMKKVFTELGGDLHSMTAQSLFCSDISLEEFILRKKEDKYKKARFKAKGANFSLEFGSSGIAFAQSTLIPEWEDLEIEDYLISNKITHKPSELYKTDISKKRDLSLSFCKYWAVANDIRRKFFSQYSGLKSWIDSSIKFAEENGYVVSPYGCIRRLPQLLYKGEGSREIKNLQNISLNSPVQNFEASLINSTIVHLSSYIKENKLRSYVSGSVHDSIIIYVFKEELEIIKKALKDFFEKERDENNSIPMELEFDLADYYGKNEVWGFGTEIK